MSRGGDSGFEAFGAGSRPDPDGGVPTGRAGASARAGSSGVVRSGHTPGKAPAGSVAGFRRSPGCFASAAAEVSSWGHSRASACRPAPARRRAGPSPRRRRARTSARLWGRRPARAGATLPGGLDLLEGQEQPVGGVEGTLEVGFELVRVRRRHGGSCRGHPPVFVAPAGPGGLRVGAQGDLICTLESVGRMTGRRNPPEPIGSLGPQRACCRARSSTDFRTRPVASSP